MALRDQEVAALAAALLMAVATGLVFEVVIVSGGLLGGAIALLLGRMRDGQGRSPRLTAEQA